MALCLRRGVQSRLLQGRGVWTVLSTVVWGWESGWLGPTHGKAVRKDHTLCSGSPVVARGCGGGRLVFVAQLSPLDCARPVPQNDWRASGPTLCCCLVAVTHTSPRGTLDRRRTAPSRQVLYKYACTHWHTNTGYFAWAYSRCGACLSAGAGGGGQDAGIRGRAQLLLPATKLTCGPQGWGDGRIGVGDGSARDCRLAPMVNRHQRSERALRKKNEHEKRLLFTSSLGVHFVIEMGAHCTVHSRTGLVTLVTSLVLASRKVAQHSRILRVSAPALSHSNKGQAEHGELNQRVHGIQSTLDTK